MAIFSVGHSTLAEKDFVRLMGSVPTLVDVRSHPGSRAHPQFNRAAMSQWLVQAGKKYEWWPELGGWTEKHMPIAQEFLRYRVDVAAYSGGHFPKQLISSSRIDAESVLKQIKVGCSCSIPYDIAERISRGDDSAETRIYRVRLMGQMEKDIKELKKPKCKRKSTPTGQLPLFGDSPVRDVTKNCPSCGRPVVAPQWVNRGLYDYSYYTMTDEFRDGVFALIESGRNENVAMCCCEALYYKCHRSLISDCLYHLGIDVSHIAPDGKLKRHSGLIGNRIERYSPEIVATWDSWLKGK